MLHINSRRHSSTWTHKFSSKKRKSWLKKEKKNPDVVVPDDQYISKIHLPECDIKAFSVFKKVGECSFMILSRWRQEDVEEHRKEHKDYIGHYTQPETWVFE